MTAPTLNLPLLRKAVEWAEAEAAKPDQMTSEWCQQYFAIEGEAIGRECGTAYCIAGYVVHLIDAEHGDSAIKAAKALGIPLSEHNADRGLFDANNTIEDVRRIAERIAARAGERL